MKLCTSALLLLALGVFSTSASYGDEAAERAAALEAAKLRASSARHLLRYKYKAGEEVRWKVVHVATTETTVQGNSQTSRSRSVSTKVWKIKDVDDDGQVRLVHQVDDVDMWQHSSGQPEVRYNSRTDAKPPALYAKVASTVGVPLATITLSSRGEVVKRDGRSQLSLGLGNIALPLPEKAVAVGEHWFVPREVKVRLKDGRVKRIKTRMRLTLKQVKTGVATVAITTETLTPSSDPAIRAELAQELTNGSIRFDLDAGRIIAKEVEWDETVVAFSGAGSMMKYRARFSEELIRASRLDAATTSLPGRAQRDDKPVIRR